MENLNQTATMPEEEDVSLSNFSIDPVVDEHGNVVEEAEESPAEPEQKPAAEPEQNGGRATKAEAEKEPAEEGQNPTQGEDEFILRVNHKTRVESKESVRKLAQKQLSFEERQKPTVDKLVKIAKSEGLDLNGLADRLLNDKRKKAEEELEDKIFDEEIRKKAVEEQIEKILGAEMVEESDPDQDYIADMAAQFGELQKTFPEFATFDQVPDDVLREAAKSGITLEHAMLKREIASARQKEKIKKAQDEARESSVGAKTTRDEEGMDKDTSDMLRWFS